MKKVFIKALGSMVDVSEENRKLLEFHGLEKELDNEDIFKERTEQISSDGKGTVNKRITIVPDQDDKHFDRGSSGSDEGKSES